MAMTLIQSGNSNTNHVGICLPDGNSTHSCRTDNHGPRRSIFSLLTTLHGLFSNVGYIYFQICVQIYYFFLIYANYTHINYKERAYTRTRVLCSPSLERGLGWGYPPKLSKRISASSTPREWSRSRTVFAIGVVQDSVETALNSNGDVFFTVTAEEFDRKKKK